MLSPAFWLVSGLELEIARSDDPQHTALLQTTGNCLGKQFGQAMSAWEIAVINIAASFKEPMDLF